MRELSPPHFPLQDVKLLSVIATNIIPVIGLLVFDTSPAALLTFYWLELGVLAVWAIVRALFAGHRPDRPNVSNELQGTIGAVWALLSKRFSTADSSGSSSSDGSLMDKRVSTPHTNVGIYVGTIPALFFIIPLLTIVWIGFGGLVAGPVIAAADVSTTPTWVLTGAGVVFLSEAGQTISDYFYGGEHRETSAWMAARGIFWQGFALAGAGLLILSLAYESSEGSPVSVERTASEPLIFTAIACKFLIDLTSYYLGSCDKPLRELL